MRVRSLKLAILVFAGLFSGSNSSLFAQSLPTLSIPDQTDLSRLQSANFGRDLPSYMRDGDPNLANALSLSDIDDERVLRLADKLGLEHQRYLLYLYARLDRPKVAERLAEKILTKEAGDKTVLMVLASMYGQEGRREKLESVAEELIDRYPADDQAIYFLGASHYLNGRYREANAVFRGLKRDQYRGRTFPYTTDLASAAFQHGDWYNAMLAYQELLRHHDLDEELRAGVRRVLDGIYRRYLPRLESQLTFSEIDRGRRTLAEIAYDRQLTERTRLEVLVEDNQVEILESQEFRPSISSWLQAMGRMTTAHNEIWEHSLWGGAHEEGPMAGTGVTRQFGKGRWLRLQGDYGVRSRDSFVFEAANARQDQLQLVGSYPFEQDIHLNGTARVRRLSLGEEMLGRGRDFFWGVEKVLFRQSPDVRVGYRGQSSSFRVSGQGRLPARLFQPLIGSVERSLLTRNAILPRINRHGLYIRLSDDLSESIQYRLGGGLDYLFYQKTPGYDGYVGLSFWPRKSVELRADGRYASSANTSDNASELVEFVLGMRYTF